VAGEEDAVELAEDHLLKLLGVTDRPPLPTRGIHMDLVGVVGHSIPTVTTMDLLRSYKGSSISSNRTGDDRGLLPKRLPRLLLKHLVVLVNSSKAPLLCSLLLLPKREILFTLLWLPLIRS